MARSRGSQQYWQGFADLSMALMAVFVLVLVILLWRQGQLTREVEAEKERAETEKERAEQVLAELRVERERLELERGDFALELIELFDTTHRIVVAQDSAEDWLRAVFEEGDCRLRMNERGELVIATAEGDAAASLYDSGRFALSVEGREALVTCRDNFLKLAYCLAPPEDAPPHVLERHLDRCNLGDLTIEESLPVLRRGIEALTLEGNTDRIPIGGGTPAIRARGAAVPFHNIQAGSFVENAYLGSERARQALGNLIAMVEDADVDEWDALQVLMSRVRIESPSFGRFQAGPPQWRELGCAPDQSGCAAARNLALRIRWQKEALRRPFELVRVKICDLLADTSTAFAQGLVSQGRELSAERARFACDEGG